MTGSITAQRGRRGAIRRCWGGLAVLALLVLLPGAARAAVIRIGTISAAAAGPIFIAKEKGYFGAEGLETQIVPCDTPESAAAAVASGAADFGAAPVSAGVYGLAGQGPLRIIAGLYSEAPGFHLAAIIASDPAYDQGLRSVKGMAGHSVALAAPGSAAHYSLGLLAAKYGVDLATMRLVAAPTPRDALGALGANQAEMAIIPASAAEPALKAGQAKLLGWVGDETPWQAGVSFTTARMLADHSSTVQAFLRALRKGAHDYHDAFADPKGRPQDGPGAAEALVIIGKYAHLAPDQVRLGIAYVDAAARLERRDILHQLQWFKQQNLLGSIDPGTVIAQDYVIPLPE